MVNPWIMAELMTMGQCQSLEGLGLMRVSLYRSSGRGGNAAWTPVSQAHGGRRSGA